MKNGNKNDMLTMFLGTKWNKNATIINTAIFALLFLQTAFVIVTITELAKTAHRK